MASASRRPAKRAKAARRPKSALEVDRPLKEATPIEGQGFLSRDSGKTTTLQMIVLAAVVLLDLG
jgi:hypothetical protein